MRNTVQNIEAALSGDGKAKPELPHIDGGINVTRPMLDIAQHHPLSLKCHRLLHAAWAEAIRHRYGVEHAMMPTDQDIAIRQQIEILLDTGLRPREDKE